MSVVYFSICKSRPNTPQLRLEPSSCFSSLNQITNPQLPPLQIFLLAASAPLTRSLPGLLAGLPMGCCSEPLHWLFPLPGMLFPQTLVGFLPPLIKIITLLQHPDLREAAPPPPLSLSIPPSVSLPYLPLHDTVSCFNPSGRAGFWLVQCSTPVPRTVAATACRMSQCCEAWITPGVLRCEARSTL